MARSRRRVRGAEPDRARLLDANMIAYHHAIIAHGKAIAECLAEHRPLSDLKYRRSFRFVENDCGGWNLVAFAVSESTS
jgi:hypothetical protein